MDDRYAFLPPATDPKAQYVFIAITGLEIAFRALSLYISAEQ